MTAANDPVFVDLTCPLSPATLTYPGDPAVTLVKACTHSVDGYEVTRVCLGSHSGTHLDAPRHFFPDGATLDEYPLDRLVGRGVIVDVRPRTTTTSGSDPAAEATPPGAAIPVEVARTDAAVVGAALLSERLRLAGSAPGDFILLWTEGAWLSPEAARLLLDTGTGLVGTDGPSLDPPPPGPSDRPLGAAVTSRTAEPYAAHSILLGNGVLLAERLCNLDKLGPGPVTCAFLPLAVVGTDGAPVRAIAWR